MAQAATPGVLDLSHERGGWRGGPQGGGLGLQGASPMARGDPQGDPWTPRKFARAIQAPASAGGRQEVCSRHPWAPRPGVPPGCARELTARLERGEEEGGKSMPGGAPSPSSRPAKGSRKPY